MPQAWPHDPQLRMSLCRSAQPALGQQVCEVAQGAPDGKQPQLPPMHTVPVSHAALQPPQLWISIEVSTQVEPQQVPLQFPGWLGQMKPPEPAMSTLPPPPPPPESLQAAIEITLKAKNSERILVPPRQLATVPRAAVGVKP